MSGSLNWGLIFVVFVLPLVLGVASLFSARVFRRLWARIAVPIICSVLLLACFAVVAEIAPYLWALHLEAEWYPANPKTKAQLESFLSLYSVREIRASQSMWGHDYQLQPGERMMQYRLLYRAPLEVVYTSSNTIVAIYTSYE